MEAMLTYNYGPLPLFCYMYTMHKDESRNLSFRVKKNYLYKYLLKLNGKPETPELHILKEQQGR